VLDVIPKLRENFIQDARFKSPFIVTNHVEIFNTVALILLSCSEDSSSHEEKLQLEREKIKLSDIIWHLDPLTIEGILSKFYPDFPDSLTTPFAQCYPALTRLAVYTTALRNDHNALLAFLRYITQKDARLAMVAVGCVLNAWNHVGTPSGLCEAYSVVLGSSHSAEVRSVARINMAELLDQSFSLFDLDNEKIFQSLLKILQNTFRPRRNATQNWLRARVKIAGWIFVAAFNSTSNVAFKEFEQEFRVWGSWLNSGGAASNVRATCVHNATISIPSSNINRTSTCAMLLHLVCILFTAIWIFDESRSLTA
jgi:hypothetical protein